MKKAQIATDTVFFWCIFLFFVTFLLGGFLWAGYVYHTRQLSVPEGLEEHLVLERFLNSKECFLDVEPITGVAERMVISWDRFGEKNLEHCYYTEADRQGLAFKLTLSTNGEEKSAATRNWNGTRVWERRAPIPAVIAKDGKKVTGHLIVEVQRCC